MNKKVNIFVKHIYTTGNKMCNGIIKNLVMHLIRMILHVFYLFSIKNRIIFIPQNGNFYCNLKYIYEKLAENNDGIDLCWITNNEAIGYPKQVKQIKLRSIKAVYYLLTSKIILFNNGMFSYIPKRKCQVYIETWHGGGAYKRCNNVFKDNPDKYEKKRTYIVLQEIDYFVASCGKFIEAMKKDVGNNCRFEFLPIGMPRNDIFFVNNKIKNISIFIKQKYQIDTDIGVVLYAPTFRQNNFIFDINIELLLRELEMKFNSKFVFLIRAHPHVHSKVVNDYNASYVINVSDYPDMQELLCATNVLITDYSSSIWDYSLLKRPCFIYANDLNQYINERNFYTPINEWPFPLAQNNDELIENIKCFDFVQYNKKIMKHLNSLDSYEKGTASIDLSKLILDKCNIN